MPGRRNAVEILDDLRRKIAAAPCVFGRLFFRLRPSRLLKRAQEGLAAISALLRSFDLQGAFGIIARRGPGKKEGSQVLNYFRLNAEFFLFALSKKGLAQTCAASLAPGGGSNAALRACRSLAVGSSAHLSVALLSPAAVRSGGFESGKAKRAARIFERLPEIRFGVPRTPAWSGVGGAAFLGEIQARNLLTEWTAAAPVRSETLRRLRESLLKTVAIFKTKTLPAPDASLPATLPSRYAKPAMRSIITGWSGGPAGLDPVAARLTLGGIRLGAPVPVLGNPLPLMTCRAGVRKGSLLSMLIDGFGIETAALSVKRMTRQASEVFEEARCDWARGLGTISRSRRKSRPEVKSTPAFASPAPGENGVHANVDLERQVEDTLARVLTRLSYEVG